MHDRQHLGRSSGIYRCSMMLVMVEGFKALGNELG